MDRRATLPRPVRATPGATRQRTGRKPQHANARRFLITAIALLALLPSALAWVLTSPALTVRTVTISGTNDMALIQSIRRLRLDGCNAFRCDTHAIEARVERLPAVAKARVTIALPDTLAIAVTPRQPAYLWRTGKGTALVAPDGMVLGMSPVASDSVETRLPVVEDRPALAFGGKTPQPGMRISIVTMEMAVQLRETLTGIEGNWTLQLTGDRGFVADSVAGTSVIFGTPEDATRVAQGAASPVSLGVAPDSATVRRGIRQQALELRAILAGLAKSGAHASLIDLRWGLHPYYRLGQ